MSTFLKTRAALAAYDADTPRRDALWTHEMSASDVHAAQAAELAAVNKVREAFAEDTAEINSRERAFLVHPQDSWLRHAVEHASENPAR